MELEFFASCLSGLEKVLADELISCGIERVRPLSGGVAFFCTPEGAYRACLWSRIASRIMLVLDRVSARDASALYECAYNIAWEDVVAEGATFAVRAHGTNEQLRNTRFTSLKVKDAIVDRMQNRSERRPQVDVKAPRAAVDVRIRDNRATVSLDFSGEALNRRSYLLPDDTSDAPLECSLAAGALALSGWTKRAGALSAFVDPACRDGILVTEAASIACNRAPGLGRSRWGFAGWVRFDESSWNAIVEEAYDRFEEGLASMAGDRALEASASSLPDLDQVRCVGMSTSSPMISRARQHVKRAGLRQAVSIERGDAETASDVVARVTRVVRKQAAQTSEDAAFCMVASNLDSLSRSNARAHVQADEASFLAACDAAPDGSRFVALAASDINAHFGYRADMSFSMGKGRVEAVVDVYDGRPTDGEYIEVADLSGGSAHRIEVLEPASEQFASRLRKMFKIRRKWAERQGTSCYRIYDSDLPDYAVAIDWYAGAADARGNNYLHIAEYAPPASVDAEKARRRFNDILTIAPVVCGIRPDHVFSKRRVRDKGGSQYRNAGDRPYRTIVEENGYRFEVDLAGRLDTGLFLDHRMTRQLIAEKAKGCRFLNLFAYTGTASVYAAGAGAISTTTLDLSQTYLDWARRNMAVNGFTGDCHEFVRADVMRWITESRRSGKRFDLIFVDPPTFSNSKAMGKKTWDVQRDHVELLIGVTHLLSEKGLAVFSCNLRSFKPYVDDLARYGVRIDDISSETIPEDFSRTPKIHKCFLVRRMQK